MLLQRTRPLRHCRSISKNQSQAPRRWRNPCPPLVTGLSLIRSLKRLPPHRTAMRPNLLNTGLASRQNSKGACLACQKRKISYLWKVLARILPRRRPKPLMILGQCVTTWGPRERPPRTDRLLCLEWPPLHPHLRWAKRAARKFTTLLLLRPLSERASTGTRPRHPQRPRKCGLAYPSCLHESLPPNTSLYPLLLCPGRAPAPPSIIPPHQDPRGRWCPRPTNPWQPSQVSSIRSPTRATA